MLAFATGWLPPVAFKLRPPELTFDPGSVGRRLHPGAAPWTSARRTMGYASTARRYD